MGFPVMAALQGLSLAAPLVSSLFKKDRKYGDIPSPEFFGPEFENLLTKTRQGTQSQFADVDAMIRESLADAGVLRSGALPDALTRSSIAQGQQIAGQTADLTGREYAAKRDFDISRFDALFGAGEREKDRALSRDQNLLETLSQLGLGVGTLIAGKNKKKAKDYNSTVRNPDGTSVDVTYEDNELEFLKQLLGV